MTEKELHFCGLEPSNCPYRIPCDMAEHERIIITEIRAEERAKTIEFVVDKIIFPLLNEYDIRLWEDIDYIELAEKWVEFVNARKGENDDITNDLKNWIAEQMKGGAE